jgi:hypothetical protein
VTKRKMRTTGVAIINEKWAKVRLHQVRQRMNIDGRVFCSDDRPAASSGAEPYY